jgi:ABC-type transport system involved in multi-copper enzyme maturation permease subunit
VATEPRLGLGLIEASRVIAGVALQRALRRRAVWIGLALSLLLPVIALITVGCDQGGRGSWRQVFEWVPPLLAIVPTLLVAGAVGEDLEDRTSAYLWSRPLPRRSLITGKLLAMAPLAFAVMAVGVIAAFALTWRAAAAGNLDLLARGVAALALGVAAVSAASAALATLSPRFATALSVIYVLFVDTPMGIVPLAMRELSITYQVTQVAGVDQYPPPLTGSVLALVGVTAAWTAIALWRIGRVE